MVKCAHLNLLGGKKNGPFGMNAPQQRPMVHSIYITLIRLLYLPLNRHLAVVVVIHTDNVEVLHNEEDVVLVLTLTLSSARPSSSLRVPGKDTLVLSRRSPIPLHVSSSTPTARPSTLPNLTFRLPTARDLTVEEMECHTSLLPHPLHTLAHHLARICQALL